MEYYVSVTFLVEAVNEKEAEDMVHEAGENAGFSGYSNISVEEAYRDYWGRTRWARPLPWSTGSEIASRVVYIMEQLHDGYYQDGLEEAYKDLIEVFESYDCDTLYKIIGESDAFDEAYRETYPEHYEELIGED